MQTSVFDEDGRDVITVTEIFGCSRPIKGAVPVLVEPVLVGSRRVRVGDIECRSLTVMDDEEFRLAVAKALTELSNSG